MNLIPLDVLIEIACCLNYCDLMRFLATSREIRSMRDRPILVERMKRIAPKIGPRGVVGPVGSVGSCDGPRGCLPNGHPDKFKSKRQLKKEKLFKRQLSQRHK